MFDVTLFLSDLRNLLQLRCKVSQLFERKIWWQGGTKWANKKFCHLSNMIMWVEDWCNESQSLAETQFVWDQVVCHTLGHTTLTKHICFFKCVHINNSCFLSFCSRAHCSCCCIITTKDEGCCCNIHELMSLKKRPIARLTRSLQNLVWQHKIWWDSQAGRQN